MGTRLPPIHVYWHSLSRSCLRFGIRSVIFTSLTIVLFIEYLAFIVIRCMLVKQNQQFEKDELENMTGARRERIEEAARLEGLTFEEALERKKGFRYLI